MYNTNITRINGNIVSVESETYIMRNNSGMSVTVVEDYGNDVSYLLMDGNDIMKFEDACRAANYAFRLGFRE